MTQPLNNTESLYDDEDDLFDNIAEDDYVFIMDSEGNLKTVMLPEEYDANDLPENIQKALHLFGVSKLTNRTLH